ncbi:MAG: single-stranded-DNA-specific exonuclease RecJ [Coriobacteriia bacterium]|nr:single-stranded-DNA-specific exonuclease RecJ [Coriobacteriia bacterium]
MMTSTQSETCGHSGRWAVRQVDGAVVVALSRETGLSVPVCRVLAARGLTDPEEIRRFIDPSLERDWLEPSVIPGMSAAAERVAAAVREGQRIIVFGDFDLDGISSAAVATRGLRLLGATVDAVVPHRFREGYGLSAAAIERLLSMRPDLVVTVDCGISAAAEVDSLRAQDVDIVITDHHEPGLSVPSGVPVANPKLAPDCGSFDLAGAGVALKLIQAVGARLERPDVWRELTDLAMLGTVADIVTLRGENRALVADGVARIRAGARVSIASLADVAGFDPTSLTADDVAFSLAPRLNAAGRMADPAVALDLLLSDDPQTCERLAGSLDEQNRIRQAVEHDLSEAAIALAERTYREGDRALVLAGEGWHEGVKGIVASRLANRFRVPTILFAVSDGEAQGSGRSYGTVDLYRAVSACSEYAVRFGGHAAAVGVTVAAQHVDAFRSCLLAHLAQIPDESFISERTCDALLPLEDVSVELGVELAQLEPFGHGNPRPLFASDGVFMNGRQRVGKTANHLKFTAFDGTTSVPAIAFRCRDIEEAVGTDAPVDLAYEISVDEWRGRRRVQLMVRDFEVRPAPAYAPAAELVEDLFARADDIIAREEYSGITDAESFHTKLAGVTFEGRQDVIGRLEPGLPLRVEREPDNPYDPNAVALIDPHGDQVGFFNRRLAAMLAPAIDAGVEYDVEVADVTGGEAERSLGLNVLVTRRGDMGTVDDDERRVAARAELSALDPEALDDALVTAFLGDRALHRAQQEALDSLATGERCLTVMATGRGKSLIFHLHAARLALRESCSSVFVFPLRALVADQSFHLTESFSSIGLNVQTITGESAPGRRDEVFAGLADGTVDVALTTPEFLDHHARRFAESGRVGFVVVDEAHHVGTARAGHRPAYARLGVAIDTLGNPGVLAVTATAGSAISAVICESLGIQRVIEDPTVRENLIIEDRRGGKDKDGYLMALAARGDKVIVYANSREQTVRLARELRKRVPAVAARVAFYNGGLGRAARHAVERAFREGDLSVVVATSAFGEGVNIPDVRHVVLYHLPFNDIEFNQMSGRAGRDGVPSRIHLLFGPNDGRVNDMVLSSGAPSRDDMAALYVELKERQGKHGAGFEATNAELAESVCARTRRTSFNDRAASAGISVFRELGLVSAEGHGPFRRLTVPPAPEVKLDLADSVRYAEGLEEIAEFAEFREWVLGAPMPDLLARFNRPILPSTS